MKKYRKKPVVIEAIQFTDEYKDRVYKDGYYEIEEE